MLTVLDAQGKMVGKDPGLTDEQALERYRAMVAAREFDERVLNLQRTGRVPAYYQSSGQEASAAAAFELVPRPQTFAGFRCGSGRLRLCPRP